MHGRVLSAQAIGCHCAGGELCPEQTALLTQQGGCLVFKGKEVVFRHDDSGILKYTDCEALLDSVQLVSA